MYVDLFTWRIGQPTADWRSKMFQKNFTKKFKINKIKFKFLFQLNLIIIAEVGNSLFI
jgi:hypothetical protein